MTARAREYAATVLRREMLSPHLVRLVLGDVVGVLGGITVGSTSLGVTPSAFIAEMRTALVLSDVWTGLIKSFFFGIAIAFIGCQQGLTTSGAASIPEDRTSSASCARKNCADDST